MKNKQIYRKFIGPVHLEMSVQNSLIEYVVAISGAARAMPV